MESDKARRWSAENAKWRSLFVRADIARSPQAILSPRLIHLLAFFIGAPCPLLASPGLHKCPESAQAHCHPFLQTSCCLGLQQSISCSSGTTYGLS